MNLQLFFEKIRANKKIFFDIFFILILSLTPLLWFQNNSIMIGHDNVFPLDPLAFFQGRLFTWIEYGLGNSQSLIMGTIPVHLVDALPYILGFSLQLTQKIVYVFWFFLIGISMYTFVSAIGIRGRTSRLLSVILYQFNFFILQGWWVGERTKFSAYIAFPLILSVFYMVYNGKLKVLYGAIFTALIYFVFNGGGLFGVSLYGGFFVAMGVFVIYYSFLSFWRKEYSSIKRLFALTILSLFFSILINAYYLFPAASQLFSSYTVGIQKNGGVDGFINWSQEISANASYTNLFRLEGISEWYDNPQHPYAKYFLTNPILILISFLWLSFIFSALLLYKDKIKLETIVYFVLVYLLGIFFTAGTHRPFDIVYTLFLKLVPGAIAFRSPYFKFAPAVFLSTSILIAYFVEYFKGRTRKLLTISIIIIVLIYHFPYFTGNFFEWKKGFSTRLQVPSYVFDFGQWMKAHESEDNRMLLLPPNNPELQYSIYNWGYLSFQALPTLITNSSVIINNDRLNGDENILVRQLYLAIKNKDINLVKKITSILRIKYILLQGDSYLDPSTKPSINNEDYRNILKNEFGLLLVNKFGEWEIYQMDFAELPKIYVTDEIDSLVGSIGKVDGYFNFSITDKLFFYADRDKLEKEESYSLSSSQNFYVPSCLNCRHDIAPRIDIQERLIFPNSPFYNLILLKENKSEQENPKLALYDDLGFSLKRIAEIRGVILKEKNISGKVFDSYLDLLAKMSKDFNLVSIYRDKFEAAEDLNYYLDAEIKYLKTLVGSEIIGGELMSKIQEVFSSISSIQNAADRFLLKVDPSTNRYYEVNIKNPGTYELFVKKEQIHSIIKDKSIIKVNMDKKMEKAVQLTSQMIVDKWLSLGEFSMSLGEHHILMSIPALSNLVEEIQSDFIAGKEGETCFSYRISNFDNTRAYKLSLNYINDFTNNLYVYIRKNTDNGISIDRTFKFNTNVENEAFDSFIYSRPDAKEVYIDLCANKLSREVLNQKIKLSVTESVQPVLMLVPKETTSHLIKQVSFSKINPTKYKVQIDNAKKGEFLVFLEQFNDEWKLSNPGFLHFQADGYANGWLINQSGDYDLTLEYRPQRFFYIGIFITTISIFGFISLLIFKKKNN
ncbi:MAG: hypothetical protein Q7K55_03730 [Candidatus Levybacteria bacterium]|nr:hypothetical protein [Candidatus Levybacteria bacterium]